MAATQSTVVSADDQMRGGDSRICCSGDHLVWGQALQNGRSVERRMEAMTRVEAVGIDGSYVDQRRRWQGSNGIESAGTNPSV